MWPASSPYPLALLVLSTAWLWGSFLNQVVDRTPFSPRAPGPRASVLGLLHPARSRCLSCGAPIAWYDNVPVLAYLWLRGRCRACGAPIGRRTLAVELATPLAALAWHGLARYAGLAPAAWLWGFAVLSWLLVAAPLAAERRQFRPTFRVLGAVALAGLAYGLVRPGG